MKVWLFFSCPNFSMFQTLTEDFRLNYCGLWQSILKADVEGIKQYSEKMGVGRLYPLFACIVTARSWKAVSSGLDKETFTQEEVSSEILLNTYTPNQLFYC